MAGRPIDEKIVVMRLDNSDFASKAANTTSLLGKLRDSLNKIPGVNLGKTTQELGAIEEKTNGIKLDRIASQLDNISSRFSAMGVVAATVISNLTNRVLDAGINMAKSLSIDQLTSGYQEYENKMGSIGTMLSNTAWEGAKLSDIKDVLADLNAYADKTVYSFGDMTENIGRFTAAGVKIKDSAIAIKGLGNLAAASGSNTEQLNSAMYQMSQALSAGKIGLEDWNSIVNAGMGGKKFQDALVATAKGMGKNTYQANGFRMSLQKGWLTSEVMLKTLKQFGDDESLTKAATSVRTFSALMDSTKEAIGSGWATTFELIFGDFDESTKLFTALSQSIGGFFNNSAKKRNDFLKGFHDGGGMQNMFAGLANAVKPVGQIFSAIGEGFKAAFPPASVATVVALSQKFKEFTSGLALNTRQIAEITVIFHAIFSVFSTAILIAKEVGKAFLHLIPQGTGDGALGLLTSIARLVLRFTDAIKYGKGLSTSMGILGNVFGVIGQVIGSIFNGLGNLAKGFSQLGEAISETWSILTKGDFTGKGPWEEDSKIVDWLFKLRDAFKSVGDWFKNNFKGFGLEDVLGAGTLVGIGLVVKKIMGLFSNIDEGFGSFKEFLEGLGEGVTGVFGDLGDSLQAFVSQVKYNNLLKIAIAVGILAVSLKLLEGMSIHDITKGITALGISLGVMMAGLSIIDKFNITGGMRASANLIALAIAVSIVASALKKIADLKPDELKRGIFGLVGIVGALAAGIIAISKWGGKIKTSSLQLMALAGAVYILADAVKKMSSIDGSSLMKSVGTLGIIFAELALFLKVVDRTKFGIGSALGVLAVSAALQVMVSAMQKIDTLNVNSLIKGLGTVAVILAEIVLFSKLVSGGKLAVAGVGLLIVAAAINALVGPIQAFASMSLTQLATGLGAMAIALAEVALAANLASGAIGGAVAITIMAAALNMLVIPIKAFAAMSWGDLIKGFVGIAGGIGLLAAAAILLSPAVVPMLAFGAALMVVGAAVLAVGAGIGLFAVGLTTLATLTAASVTAIVAALGLLLQGFATLIPAMVNFVVQVGSALITGLMTLVPQLANAVVQIIVSIMGTISAYLPAFITLGGNIIVELLNGLAQQVPRIIEAAVNLIIQVINGMTQAIHDHGPELVTAVMGLIGEILALVVEAGVQVINALFGWIPGVSGATAKIGKTAEQYLRDNFGASQAGSDKGADFANALGSKSGSAQASGAKVGQAGKQGVSAVDLLSIGSGKGSDFANALGAKSGAASSSGRSLATAGKSGAGSVDMTSTGAWFGQGFANGIGSKLGSVVSAAEGLGKAAWSHVKSWLHINSPSRKAHELGGWFGQGFSNGIDDKNKTVSDSATGLAASAQDSLSNFLDGFDPTPEDNQLHFKAVVDYDSLDPSKLGVPTTIPIKPNVTATTSTVASTVAQNRQNADNNLTKTDDEATKTRGILSSIKDVISNIDPNKPVYLVVNDKLVAQSVTKNVIDNYDLKYMKAQRGLANA
jgi:tape measure domain-containing protein